MSSCWRANPVDRPDFTKAKEMLEKLAEKHSDKRDIIYINTTVSEEEEEEQLAQGMLEGPVLTSSPSCSRQDMDASIVTVDIHESSAAEDDDRYVIVVPTEDPGAAGQGSTLDTPLLSQDTSGDGTELHQVSSDMTKLL